MSLIIPYFFFFGNILLYTQTYISFEFIILIYICVYVQFILYRISLLITGYYSRRLLKQKNAEDCIYTLQYYNIKYFLAF